MKKMRKFYKTAAILCYIFTILATMVMSIIAFIALWHLEVVLYKLFMLFLGIFYMAWMIKTIYKFSEDLFRKDGIFGPENTGD